MPPRPSAISLLNRPLPWGFQRRTLTLAPGEERPVVEAEWLDTAVTVERGEIELVCHRGGRRRFGTGALLWLTGLSLRVVRNPGDEPAVLCAVSRLPTRRTRR